MKNDEHFIHNEYGYCYYTTSDKPLIYNLFVQPECRRMGHARHLVSMAIEEIKNKCGNTRIQIEAVPKGNSISKKELMDFYKELGLEIINESVDE